MKAQTGKKLADEQAERLTYIALIAIDSLDSGADPAPARKDRLEPKGKLITIRGEIKAPD